MTEQKPKNRKRIPVKVLSTVLGLLMVAAVLVFAYYTSRVQMNAVEGEMGNIAVEASLEELDDIYFEPSSSPEELDVSFKNVGKLSTFVQVDLGVTTTRYYSLDGEGFINGYLAEPWVVENDTNVKIEALEEYIGFKNTGDGWYFWIEDLTDPGVYYLMMDPGVEVEYAVDVTFSPLMGNDYQDAKISFGKALVATQSSDEAIEALTGKVFGVDLAYVGNDLGALGRSGKSSVGANVNAEAEAALNRMLGRD